MAEAVVPKCPKCKGDNLYFLSPPSAGKQAVYKCPDCDFEGSRTRQVQAAGVGAVEIPQKSARKQRILIRMAIILVLAFIGVAAGTAYVSSGMPQEYIYAAPVVIFGGLFVFFFIRRLKK